MSQTTLTQPGIITRIMTGIAIAAVGVTMIVPAFGIPPVVAGIYLIGLGVVWAMGR